MAMTNDEYGYFDTQIKNLAKRLDVLEANSHAETANRIALLEAQRDAAIKHIAQWCVAVEVNGSGWDDWDDYYKDAMYSDRESLREIRELLVKAIEAERKLRSRL